MSSIRSNSFNFKDFTVANLNEADVVLKDKKRCQGLRYTLVRQTPNGQETKTVIFHDLYNHLQMLTKKTVEDQKRAQGKRKPYIKTLNEIKEFIPKLEAAEDTGRKHYAKQGVFYKVFTIICRIFGKSPYKGTHTGRLTTLKADIDKHIANIKAGHDLDIYAKMKSIIDKNKNKKQIFIDHHKIFPNSEDELNTVLYALRNKGKLTHFTISKSRTKIELPDLKICDEIEAIINQNRDKDEIYIQHSKKFPSVSTDELHDILLAMENKGKLADFYIEEDQIHIGLIEKDD